MTEEQIGAESAPKAWNEQLKDWAKSNGRSIGELSRSLGIPSSTMGDYLSGRITNLQKVSSERKRRLYETTHLQCFECKASTVETKSSENKDYSGRGALGEHLSAMSNEFHKTVDSLVASLSDKLGLSGNQKLGERITKSQRYSQSASQRAGAIVELIELLGSEVDYFRTASENERLVLAAELKANSDSLGYATQMLNVIYSGKGIDSWMLLTQPPAKLRKILRNSDKSGGKI